MQKGNESVNESEIPGRETMEVPEGNDIIQEPVEADENTETTKFSHEKLTSMTVKQIKELAEKNGYAITKVIKEDVIAEFLKQQG